MVTTPEEAIICALAREANDTNAISYNQNQSYNSDDSHLVLIPTRYEIPTDSVPLLSICGTDNGRIFIGGYDGCLYEMSYEAHLDKNQYSGKFYSDQDYSDDYEYDTSFDTASITSTIATTGKRALSTLLFGPTSPSEMRSKKCRKVNHSSFAPPVVSAFIPGFVLNASSAVFGSSPTLQGGAIVNLTLDHDRKTMYALTAEGYIHAFDLDNSAKSTGSYGLMNHPPKWSCSVNVTKSVRRYLDSVSHGRMYPPSNMGTDSALAAINFPGGGSGAQAGVGGMDGARSILKSADAEVLRRKSQAGSRRSANGISKSKMRPIAEGCLHPISIHVVPASESKFLTLVAISSGGLRYYLSVLPDAGTSYGNVSVRPGRRFTLCHIRAPPPFTVGNDHDLLFDGKLTADIGTTPRMNNRGGDLKGRATKGCYVSGTTMLAVDCDNPKDEHAGDSIMTLTADYTQQRKNVNSANRSQLGQSMGVYSSSFTSNGVNEIVSMPMVANKMSSVGASVLPGGHVWELNASTLNTGERNSVLRLFTRSTTPSSTGQSGKLPPAYLPPSTKRRGLNRSTNLNANMHSKSSLETATATTSKTLVASSGGLTGFLKTVLSGKNNVVSRPPSIPQRQLSAYRVSERFGCNKLGFSIPAHTKHTIGRRSSSALQASILPSAVLNPAPAPLSEMAMQHLVTNSQSGGILALNSGGIHYFTQSCPINKLEKLLTNSNVSNIGRDEHVKTFFKSYGYSESCAMCLSIAVVADGNNIVVRKAIQAALSYAHRPALFLSIDEANRTSTSSESMGIQANKLAGFEGYNFSSSFLCNGLVSIVSRLLRPVWCKVAVVVTEGRAIPPRKKGGISEQLPAKVELLLDQKTLEEIRRPLAALQTLMKEIFGPAVKSIPGFHQGDTEMKDMTAGQGTTSSNLISQSLQYQNQARFQNNSRDQQPTEKELNTAACQLEERNIHSIYRLVSRTVQLLTLVDHLHRAHFSPSLPDVEFGLIHGTKTLLLSFYFTEKLYLTLFQS